MTDSSREQDEHAATHEAPHEGPIKTPRQLIQAVIWAHIIPIVGILLLVAFVVAQMRPPAGSDALAAASIARRLEPVGRVEVRDVSDVGAMKTGEQVYAAQCSACHTAGVAGAPKLGDAAGWGPRIAHGFESLLNSALKGKGAMGPQGGGDFSDFEIARAVVYLANGAGAKYAEPKLAPDAAAATTTASAANPAPGADVTAAAAVASAQAAMANMSAGSAVAAATPATVAAPAAAAGAGAAPALYAQACQVCHVAGVAGAPKLGDKAAWAPRLPQGIDGLTASVIKGKGAMPPRGGSQGSDAEIQATVAYMVGTVK